MDDKSYWNILAAVYTDSEILGQNQGAIRQLLTADRPKREELMSDEEQKVVDDLPETVTIFRGYCFDNSHGWSWTISREQAEWFANRFAQECGGVPRVATGHVKKIDIIAYFGDRLEKEIVCDPKSVAVTTTERLDRKEDEPRVPRSEKLECRPFSERLKMHMEQNPTMTLSELRSALKFMSEEVETLIAFHGAETSCNELDGESIDSPLLKNELKAVGGIELVGVVANIEEAELDVVDLMEEHGGETLCGDFEVK